MFWSGGGTGGRCPSRARGAAPAAASPMTDSTFSALARPFYLFCDRQPRPRHGSTFLIWVLAQGRCSLMEGARVLGCCIADGCCSHPGSCHTGGGCCCCRRPSGLTCVKGGCDQRV